jgi:hypothetical protein
VPIRTLPSRAIADASIQAVDIANSSISKTKIDADTRLGLQNDSIILDGTDGAGANKGDFLSLNGTDGSSTNADDRILFDETFIDKVNLFNINTLGSSGQALKVNDAGSAFEFGSAGTNVKIAETDVTGSVSEVIFNNTVMTGYTRFKIVVHNLTLSGTVDLRMSDSPDNGSTVSFTSSYGSHYSQLGSASHSLGAATDTNYYEFAGWNFKANIGNYFEIDCVNFGRSDTNDYKKYIVNWIHYNNNNNHYGCINYFTSSLASAMNWIRFYPASGTIDEGKFIVYGVNE